MIQLLVWTRALREGRENLVWEEGGCLLLWGQIQKRMWEDRLGRALGEVEPEMCIAKTNRERRLARPKRRSGGNEGRRTLVVT